MEFVFIQVRKRNTYLFFLGGSFKQFHYLILSGSIQSVFYFLLFCTFPRIILWKNVKGIRHGHSYSTKNDDIDVPG